MANSCHWWLLASLAVPGCALAHERAHPTDSVARGASAECMGTEITACLGCDHPGCCQHFCRDGAWTDCGYVPNSCVDASAGGDR